MIPRVTQHPLRTPHGCARILASTSPPHEAQHTQHTAQAAQTAPNRHEHRPAQHGTTPAAEVVRPSSEFSCRSTLARTVLLAYSTAPYSMTSPESGVGRNCRLSVPVESVEAKDCGMCRGGGKDGHNGTRKAEVGGAGGIGRGRE